MDVITMFERAADGAAAMIGGIRADQWQASTPCTEWNVEQLVTHMAAGPGYLMKALGLDDSPVALDEMSYRKAVERCVEALRVPGALEARCMSPAGFEWAVGEAVAGTAMDQLVHTWDLAVAIGRDRDLDPELVDASVEMFLPHMPDIGRGAGLVGPEVPVPANPSAQARLLGAMGRQP